MIYPYLQYCNIVWASMYASNLSRLVILQKRVVRIINNSRYDSHINLIFKNLRRIRFNDICKLQIGQFMFLYENNILPESFENMFKLNKEVHNYDTRSACEFRIETPRTNLRQFSIKYQRPFFYNSLPELNVRQSTSIRSFTRKLIFIFLDVSCNIAVDLGFVLDVSTSMTPLNFKKLKTFMKNLVNEFDIQEGGTHVATIAFGDRAKMVFDFNALQGNDLTRANLAGKIDEISQISGSNRLDLALEMARDDMFSFIGGKRDKTPRVSGCYIMSGQINTAVKH